MAATDKIVEVSYVTDCEGERVLIDVLRKHTRDEITLAFTPTEAAKLVTHLLSFFTLKASKR